MTDKSKTNLITNISRRQLIKTGVAAAGMAAIGLPGYSRAASAETMIFLLIRISSANKRSPLRCFPAACPVDFPSMAVRAASNYCFHVEWLFASTAKRMFTKSFHR